MKKIDKQLDDAWSKKVKELAGYKCEYCGKTSPLNSHHIYSRSKKSTRWDVDNGVCLCVGHHTFSSSFSAHKTPLEFVEWVKAYRGDVWFHFLCLKANATVKLHDHEKLEILKQLQPCQ